MLATITSESINKLKTIPGWLQITGEIFKFNNLKCVKVAFPDDKLNELEKLVTFPSIDDKLYDYLEAKLKEIDEKIKIVSCSENKWEILVKFLIPKKNA